MCCDIEDAIPLSPDASRNIWVIKDVTYLKKHFSAEQIQQRGVHHASFSNQYGWEVYNLSLYEN